MQTRANLKLGLASSLVSLVGCSAVETAESEAIAACQARAGELFPAFAQRIEATKREAESKADAADNRLTANEPLDRATEAMLFGEPMSFRFVSTGQYVAETNAQGRLTDPAFRLVCSGDFNQRTINSVRFNGVIKHPTAGVVWSF